MNMKLRYRLFLRRKSVYYAFDDTTKTFTSLKTKDKTEANRLLMAMNEAGKQPAMNLSLARVYLRHSDPLVPDADALGIRRQGQGVRLDARPCSD
jgi:hypothetical protein